MRRTLFVTDTFYPDSSATTTLVSRTAEALVQLGFCVDVYPSEVSGNHFSYPPEYKGVRIVNPNAGVREEYFVPVKASEDHLFSSRQVEELTGVLTSGNYDCVFSVAIAFEVNFLTQQALQMVERPQWFPMAYDPYAFDPHISDEQRKARAVREIETLKDAACIFLLTEFKEDYIGSPIEDKIEWFMLPCIRPISPDRTKKAISFDRSFINCVFLGDFYYGVENTDFIFRLFKQLDRNIRLYTVGNLCDFGPTVELWKEKLGSRYICHERVSQEEAYNVMLDCDLLVSMGHDSANMCPSKIIDFISSGKPILHIKKIQECCGEKYLQRYPDKYCIYQNDELTQARVSEVERFILNAKGRLPITFDAVKALYGDFTMESLTDKILNICKTY